MKKTTYTNRYEDTFTFTDLENGNVLWEGNFQYHRCGMPNDYSKAYVKYQESGGDISLDEFKIKVHEYDTENNKYKMEEVYLVESMKDVIDMVDPSGGPYMRAGGVIHGKKIKEFKKSPTGYEIIVVKNEINDKNK